MIQVLYYLLLQADKKAIGDGAYDAGYELGSFLGKYGIYLGATLLVLVVLIIMYIKKHRQRTQDNNE
ncbi:MAG: hypothetical protein V7767_03160 [Leeuwenhoekiella sp.]